jgi:hypothetical protein
MGKPFHPSEIIVFAPTLSFYPMISNRCDNSKIKSTAVVIGTTVLQKMAVLSPLIEKR